ncbi:MAG TPA: ADP-ribosylglycohydrolase family protein [Chthonomonadaceae bacterium]|nr:ADP-ribosylglycohydrolase family protein [Chthonomonadaceae bacterium]
MTQSVSPPQVQEQLRDRFRGVLVGLAVGDALGAPLEFQPARKPDHYVTEMIGGGWQKLPPGQWTDDTQMALCVVESLLARRVFDPDDIARRFVVWMQSGPPDIGLHTRRVLDAISRGEPWEQASKEVQALNPDNASNGSLMRCAPLSLFLYRRPDYLATLAPVLSRITHAHPDCEWTCVFVNVAIAWLVQGKSKQEAVDLAYEACDNASQELKERIGRAMEPTSEVAPTGYVLDTLEVALWSFLHAGSFEEALLTAVNRGADADTVGAVTGALAGARYGLSQIPLRWLEVLRERDVLIDYADRLLELALSFS